MKAYDIDMLPRPADRSAADNHGWCFGVPPGIPPRQWPLDPVSGHPLMHGFTLLLPEDYRVHGPDIVALSFFATAADRNDGGAETDPALAAAVLASGDAPPSDPDLAAFWHFGRDAHPRLFRMTDILGYAYAAILLTRAEFDGASCAPPRMDGNRFLARSERPAWLEAGTGAVYGRRYFPSPENAPEKHGGGPADAVPVNRALRWTARANDPNAGKAPREGGSAEETGYQSPHYWIDDRIEKENYREHSWVAGHKPDHIGGTMRPVQGIPEFSPYYVEFEEYLGGYNFGGGNAQLDFRDMKFDWACG